MPLNSTENYLRDRQKCVLLSFADAVATSDRYLKGSGGAAGDGYPLPAPGKILRLYVYDDSSMHSSVVESSFNAGDRLSVYADYESPWFQVNVRINGVNSDTYCSQVSANSTLKVSVLVRLDVY